MVNNTNGSKIVRKLYFDYLAPIPSVNPAGGIRALCNHDNLQVRVLRKEDYTVHLYVKDKPSNHYSIVFGV